MVAPKRPKSKAVKPTAKAKTTTKASKASKTMSMPDDPAHLVRFVEDLKRQWVATLDALVDPLMIVGKDYVIRKANKALARMAGVDVKDVIGQKCHQAFAGRKTPCPGCAMPKAAAAANKTEAATTFTIDAIRGDRFYEVTSQPLFDLDGKPDGIVQVYRDRTDAKRMQEQMSQQEKLASIGLLAGGVAHEINNPLGGILIFSQMLLREMDKESSHYPDVVEIEAATQRCKAIVESLLDFARQNPAGKKVKVENVNVIDAIRTAMRFGKVSLKQASLVDIQEEFDSDEHSVTGDRNKLIQLFLNLIQNAIQAMPDGGNLVIRARAKKDKNSPSGFVARYEVEDTGVGIAPEHLGKIFDPFFTTKDPGEGTGLGLALCYGIVQDLGGVMTVESTINVGTRFIIEVPMAASAQLAQKPAS